MTRNNLSNHFRNLESAEKALLSDPCNEDKAKSINNAIKNVKTEILKLKPNDAQLKKEMVTITKALEKYVNDHNNKIVEKIKSNNIGAVPGGMKALYKQSKKEFTLESFNFMRDTQKAKKEGTQLRKIYDKYIKDINISAREKKKYDEAYKETVKAYKELNKKENKVDKDKRVKCLTAHATWVDALYTATLACRQSIVKMMEDAITRMKQRICLDF